MKKLTWDEHVVVGKELLCMRVYLTHLIRKLEATYGNNNPTASAILPILETLGTLRHKLGGRVLDETPRVARYGDVTRVYHPEPVSGCVVPLRERELP